MNTALSTFNQMVLWGLLGILSLIFLMAFSSQAMAGEPRLIGTHGDWSSYVFIENGNKVCYMASQPKNAQGNYKKRGEIYALITHRPAEGTKNVFSYITGYSYKPSSDAMAKIGNERFVLFTQDDTAWTPDAPTDNKLVGAIKKGSKMIVTGTSSRGTLTTDTYSLKGSSAAYDAISKECRI